MKHLKHKIYFFGSNFYFDFIESLFYAMKTTEKYDKKIDWLTIWILDSHGNVYDSIRATVNYSPLINPHNISLQFIR